MIKIALNINTICLVSLLVFIISVNCNDITEHYIDYEIESSKNTTNNVNNTDDGYDYELNSDVKDNEDSDKLSFIDKVKQLHEEGRNITFTKHVKHINDTFNVINNVKNVYTRLFSTDGRTGLEFMEFLSEIDTGLSAECSAALFKIMSKIKESELWALKFFDSMGRFPPSGLAEGIQSSFGEYDECLNIESPLIENNQNIIRGQYCLANVILPYPSKHSYKEGEPIVKSDGTLVKNYNQLQKLQSTKGMIEALNLSNGTVYRIGICIPSVCSPHEFENMLNKILYPITRMPVEIGPKCHMKNESINLDKFQISSISILMTLTILVVLSTGLDIYEKQLKGQNFDLFLQKPSKAKQLLLTFSIIKNTESLFAINTRFAALDTLRLLFIIHVHICHIYGFSTTFSSFVLKKLVSEVVYTVYEDNRYVFARSPLMLDALFALSGFILSFGLLKSLEKTKGRFNYFAFLFQRWIRFTVLVFGAVIFYYLYPIFGSGPVWDLSEKWVSTDCKNPINLLKNLLSVNNFKHEWLEGNTSKCVPVSWFLSALLQLIIIAPIFIITYYKNKLIGIYAIITAIIISLFSSIAPYILFGIKPYLQIWDLETTIFSQSKSFLLGHYLPTVYATSFFVGIAFGYLLKENVLFSRLQEVLFWISSIIAIISTNLWHSSFWRLDKSAPFASALLWMSVGKLLYSLGFVWIFYACSSGRGGILNRFLSWHGFQPLARLSFGIYLLHPLVIFYRIFSVKNTYVMTDKLVFENTLVDLIFDIILAYIFYILIESPFSNIFEVIYNKNKKSDPLKNIDNNKSNNDSNNNSNSNSNTDISKA